jgi:hypothetical protein
MLLVAWTKCFAWSLKAASIVFAFVFLAILLTADLILFLRDGTDFIGVVDGGLARCGESGSCGLRGPAGMVGIGAASKLT